MVRNRRRGGLPNVQYPRSSDCPHAHARTRHRRELPGIIRGIGACELEILWSLRHWTFVIHLVVVLHRNARCPLRLFTARLRLDGASDHKASRQTRENIGAGRIVGTEKDLTRAHPFSKVVLVIGGN
jgi:hypothetical protein